MSRRWRGARPAGAVLDETHGFMAGPTMQAGPETEANGAPESEAAMAAEQRQRERADRLQALYTAEIRRADEIDRNLTRAIAQIEQRDQAIAALEERLATAGDVHTAACAHAAEVRAGRRTMAAMQDRLDLLQAANEAHDRHRAAGWPR